MAFAQANTNWLCGDCSRCLISFKEAGKPDRVPDVVSSNFDAVDCRAIVDDEDANIRNPLRQDAGQAFSCNWLRMVENCDGLKSPKEYEVLSG